jgi:uncharacterized protein
MMTDVIAVDQAQTLQVPTPQEKNLAMLAHGSILLTFIVAIVTGGLGTLIAALFPLVLWYAYRDKSRYVAFHAMQATLFQLAVIGLTLLAAVVVGIVLALAWVITGLLVLVLIGLLLIPVALLLTVVLGLVLPIIPLAALGYGLLGVWEIYNGRDFEYYRLAEWLNQQNRGQLFAREA